MKINPLTFSFVLGTLIQLNSTTIYSQPAPDTLGTVKAVEGRGYRVRKQAPRKTLKEGDTGVKVILGDTLRTHISGGRLELGLGETAGATITISEGSLELTGNTDNPICNIPDPGGLVRFAYDLEKDPIHCRIPNRFLAIEDPNTIFEVHAQPEVTRVFVYSGHLFVTSTHPKYITDRIEVKAGQWVSANGGEVNGPKTFIQRRDGPYSGSSECIYSDCRIVNKVPIPPPPVFTPSVLEPPDPNPPGQR